MPPRGKLAAARRRIGTYLFPDSAPPSSELRRWEAAVLVIALLVLGTVLALLRLGFSDSLNTIWAEDGPIYLQGALTESFWHAVFSPYAGYLVVVPRLIGEAATLVPLEQAAAAISLISAFFAALSGLVVWCASGGQIRNPYLRGGLALATVLAAAAGQETLLSAAYVPWYMLFASFWLLFWRPRTLAAAAAGGLFLLATGLSTPGVWFFLPVALLRVASFRDARDASLLGPYFLGALVQVPVILGQEQGEAIWTSRIWGGYLQRVVDGGLLGQSLGGDLWSSLGIPFLIVLVAAVGAGLAWGLWKSSPGPRWFGVAAVLTSLVMFVVSVYQRAVGENIFWATGASGGAASRYVLVPALLLLSAGVVFVDYALRGRPAELRMSWPVAAALGLIGLAIVTSYDMRAPESRGKPYWDDALHRAASRCVKRREEIAAIPTSPKPFGVQIPCQQVASLAERSDRR
jgi:hypothetical protein